MGHLTFREKANIIVNAIKWRLTWNRRNTHYRFTVEDNPKFMGPRDAVKLIKDGDVCMVAGLAGNQRISILAWAIREVFEETGIPNNLTLISLGGQGGRGMAPGTLEELGQEGLVTRFICAHHETYKSLLKLAAQKKLELQCLPQGVIALLIDAQAQGEDCFIAATGIGTSWDPRVGAGSTPFDSNAEQLITVKEDKLCYRLPKIDVALFNAPEADREGNIYINNCATISETKEAALAARKNGGKVIANVGRVVDEKREDEIFLHADQIDAIVQYYDTEQTCGFKHSEPSDYFYLGSEADAQKGIEFTRFVGLLMGITPKRNKVQKILARLTASLICKNVPVGAYMNIGTGLPEEVGQILLDHDLIDKDYTLFTEAGVIGGIPAPGIFFGAAIKPKEIISSPQIFKKIYKHLDATILGFLQVDSEGNVNSSKRGEGEENFVGPGGFIDFTSMAQNIFFIGSWTAGGKVKLANDKIKLGKLGKPKFVSKVNEITFSGKEALKAGKNVFYITNVGAFQLTQEGVKLIYLMPGVDIDKDIKNYSKMEFVLSKDTQQVDQSIVTGNEFTLKARTK